MYMRRRLRFILWSRGIPGGVRFSPLSFLEVHLTLHLKGASPGEAHLTTSHRHGDHPEAFSSVIMLSASYSDGLGSFIL